MEPLIAAASGWNPPWHGVIVYVVGVVIVWAAFKGMTRMKQAREQRRL